jgi:hypothetical protein
MRPQRATEIRELALMVQLREVPGLALDVAADEELLPQVTARQYFEAIDRFGTPQVAIGRPGDYMPGPDASRLNALAARLVGGAIAVGPQGARGPSAPALTASAGAVAADGAACTLLTTTSGVAEATWLPPASGVAIGFEGSADVQLFMGLYAPADTALDLQVVAALRSGETIWLPKLPGSLHWTLVARATGDATLHICSRV